MPYIYEKGTIKAKIKGKLIILIISNFGKLKFLKAYIGLKFKCFLLNSEKRMFEYKIKNIINSILRIFLDIKSSEVIMMNIVILNLLLV